MKKLLLVLLVLFGLQTQAQINICDSIELSIAQGQQSWFITIESNIPQMIAMDTTAYATYNWTSCLMCGTNVGSDTLSQLSFFTDTLQMYSVCLTSTICTNGLCYACTTCDTLVWNNGSWGMMSMINNNPTSIEEIQVNNINDNKMYDLLGREVTDVPLGTIYIVNRKKYIKK